jgi:hypothetical protein
MDDHAKNLKMNLTIIIAARATTAAAIAAAELPAAR